MMLNIFQKLFFIYLIIKNGFCIKKAESKKKARNKNKKVLLNNKTILNNIFFIYKPIEFFGKSLILI